MRYQKSSQPSRKVPEKGVALVVVLMMMVLVTLLSITLLMVADNEFRASNGEVEMRKLEELADDTFNIVIGQIRDATSDLGSTHTWTSQPGMIRRFGTDPMPSTRRSQLSSAYKLYSAPVMVEGSSFDPASDLPPEDWQSYPEIFTDLNETGSNGTYPIIDPSLTEVVDGFEIEKIPGVTEGQAPMPTRWLYVLRDGTFGHLDSNGKFNGLRNPTEDNPITGRIAFWTDDETCKVNINTASEGVFWDHPLGHTRTERGNAPDISSYPEKPYGYASSMPVRGEFSRYPGHPAETSLSGIFGSEMRQGSKPVTNLDELERYYDLTPRVVLSGSRGANVLSHFAKIEPQDDDRLYATVDEFLFAQNSSNRKNREQNVLSANGIDPTEILKRSRFFLTANSRAPETTLFNRPKVALWPLYREALEKRNPTERLLAFCSTAGGHPYYIQRHAPSETSGTIYGSAYSTTQDLEIERNQQMLDYLRKSTSKLVPGFGGTSFKAKWGKDDQEQVTLSMVDWLRSSVNLFNRGIAPTHQFTGHNPQKIGEFMVAPMVMDENSGKKKGFGLMPTITEAALILYATEVEPGPLANTAARATRVQAFLVFETFKPAPGMPHQSPGMEIKVEGLDQFQLNDRSMQFPEVGRTFIEREQHGGGWGSFTSHSPILLQLIAHGGAKTAPGSPPPWNDERAYRVHQLISQPIALVDDPADTRDTMKFTGGTIKVTLKTHPKSGFSEEMQVLYLNFPSSSEWPVPRATEGVTLPEPFDARASRSANPGNASLSGAPQNDHPKIAQLLGFQRDYRRVLIQENDVVRSIEIDPAGPTKGDYRLVAGRFEIPENYFRPHPDYHSKATGKRHAQSLRDDRFSGLGMFGWNGDNNTIKDEIVTNDVSRPSNQSTTGRLVENASYGPFAAPVTANGLNGATMNNNRPGDWENGLAILPDGPFVRRNFEAGASRRNDSFIKDDSSYYTYGYYYHDNTGIDFAPNRQVASGVIFGAMPTGIYSQAPWQTLLFCPNPPARSTGALDPIDGSDHAGFAIPPDHLLLDLFWMPVVEPYAISEPLSTAGKVNMNYEMMPFSYIKRRTAMHSVLKNMRVAAIPADAAGNWPSTGEPGYKDLDVCPWEFRYQIDLDATTGTLRGFEERFDIGDVFRSPSEMCDVFLVPKKIRTDDLPPESAYPPGAVDGTYETMTEWWDDYQLTGDNAREMPYNHIVPRLTTRSNTYRIHYRVQVLKKSRNSDPDTWDNELDQVKAESRGSALIERYINPNSDLPDFADPAVSDTEAVDDHCQYRILNQQKFY